VETKHQSCLVPCICPATSTNDPPLRYLLVTIIVLVLKRVIKHEYDFQDLELAKSLVRTSSLFVEDLAIQMKFSKEGYGSVSRSFIVCTEDLTIPMEYQQWMIQNAVIDDVLSIEGADHMAMNSKPRELFDSLQKIATKYA